MRAGWIFCGVFCCHAFCSAAILPQNLNAEFKQIIKSDGGVLNYYGQAKVVGDEWAFSYIEPEHKRICGNASQAVLIDDDLEQITVVKDAKSLKEILSKAKQISDDKFRAKVGEIEYEITTAKDGQITEIAYTDELQNEVIIYFASALVSIDCSQPDDYDVVENDSF